MRLDLVYHIENVLDARACVGGTCVLLRDLSNDWRAQLAQPHNESGCPRRLSGCPWPSCKKTRASLPARLRSKRSCAPAGLRAPVRCRDRRLLPFEQSECAMIEHVNKSRGSQQAENAKQCSGSLGEEQFVLNRFFGARRAPARHGTFLELGAFDGWQESNTLHLESCLGWRGVLIDAPTHLDWLAQNRPNSLSAGLAICPEAGWVNYSSQRATTAGIMPYMSSSVRRRFRVAGAGVERVACGPLGALLDTLGVRHLDFFSLDVQGAEAMVLKTIDWTKLTVGVLIAECKALGCRDPQDDEVRALLEVRPAPGLRRAVMLRARHDVFDAVYVNSSLWARYSAMTS